jgi:cell cycle checkpoint protein
VSLHIKHADPGSFIPIAHTFITKALKAVVYRHMERTNIGPQAKYAGSSFKESSIQLIAATCNGDLRSAINSLQMLRSGGLIAGARESRKPKLLAGTVVKGRGSKGGKGARIDADEGVRAA